jgi:hypothetical protein
MLPRPVIDNQDYPYSYVSLVKNTAHKKNTQGLNGEAIMNKTINRRAFVQGIGALGLASFSYCG